MEKINEIMNNILSKLDSEFEDKTVVGQPIIISENEKIYPISKQTFGVIGGCIVPNNDNSKKQKDTSSEITSDISGGGYNLEPIGFLIVNKDGIKYEHTQKQEDNIALKLLKFAIKKIKG